MLKITQPTNPPLVIMTHNLSKEFNGSVAVEDVNLAVPEGKIFGFIGPSGCGKTTTVRLLVGTHVPTSGEVRVLGRSPQEFRRHERENIGYMPQQFVLYPDLTVQQNLNFAASLYGLGWRERRARITAMLDLVELREHAHKMAQNISGGMQRRLSLASTMMHEPSLLFLDEPTAGVDPVLRRKFWDYFRVLQRKGHTLFITTQYVNEAAYCDLVGVMSRGRVLTVDTPEGLRRKTMGGDIILMQLTQSLPMEQWFSLQELPFIAGQVYPVGNNTWRMVVTNASIALPELVQWTQTANLEVVSLREHQPSFDDVFLQLMQEDNSDN
ncbi:MAG: ABC transporter ATP-binding protein [Chloroflexi bacterium]|nr:ABC transporter ATP-binding protein [Chloroflexota bacterium]MBP8058481.1 ABC transporter ATP-binding protein [Chloroflexota bacterium]